MSEITSTDQSASLAIPSPPASPYAKLASIERSHVPKIASTRFDPSTPSPYKVKKHSPQWPMVTCAWSIVKEDPAKCLRQEKALMDSYGLHSLASSVLPGYSIQGSYAATISGSSNPASKARSRTAGSNKARYSRARPQDSKLDIREDSSDGSSRAFKTSSRPLQASFGQSETNTSADRDTKPKRPAARPRTPCVTSSSTVHDMPADELVDYSPTHDTLPQGKPLKAEWKGAPMDLSKDPKVSLLHPAEVQLAAVLRLPVDVYLDSKKRLFAEKVFRLRKGLPFRRTDSQKACRIDVNKASRLFSAYEKVGWLDDHHFQSFL